MIIIILIIVKLSRDLMDPESEEVSREWGTLVGGEEKALEHVAQVSQVEDVVELDCCWRKHLSRDEGEPNQEIWI